MLIVQNKPPLVDQEILELLWDLVPLENQFHQRPLEVL
jgi:hypothetical protein